MPLAGHQSLRHKCTRCCGGCINPQTLWLCVAHNVGTRQKYSSTSQPHYCTQRSQWVKRAVSIVRSDTALAIHITSDLFFKIVGQCWSIKVWREFDSTYIPSCPGINNRLRLLRFSFMTSLIYQRGLAIHQGESRCVCHVSQRGSILMMPRKSCQRVPRSPPTPHYP